MSFFENTRKPVGFGGKIMVAMMNVGHSAVARWGLQFLNAAPDAKVLDCGCGGGANMKRLLKKCPQGVVKGIDYSPVSVKKSKRFETANSAVMLLCAAFALACEMARSLESTPSTLFAPCMAHWRPKEP